MNKDIFLTNSYGGKKEKFEPLDENNIKMYVCGPTVYDDPHIGNARPLVVFDILFKVLKCKYGNDKVTYIRNITDIDDKIIQSAKEYLGLKFDIHGGGRDLIFPHHENEIAQSRCANETDVFSNYWVHNGFITLSNEKMAKSQGNILK